MGVQGGSIEGPRLNGRVLSQSGGDWPRLWPSGLVDFEAHYLLEAATARPSTSTIAASPALLPRCRPGSKPGATVSPDETYCRVTPRFEVPAGPHEWLARTLFVGKGERRGAQSVFDYYVVT